jgi:hypothetical protein
MSCIQNAENNKKLCCNFSCHCYDERARFNQREAYFLLSKEVEMYCVTQAKNRSFVTQCIREAATFTFAVLNTDCSCVSAQILNAHCK